MKPQSKKSPLKVTKMLGFSSCVKKGGKKDLDERVEATKKRFLRRLVEDMEWTLLVGVGGVSA